MTQETKPLASITVGERHRKDMGDLAALAASIEDVGLLQPLVIRPDGQLVAGARRLEAVKRLGWAVVGVCVVTGLDDALKALRAERDENTQRKDFTPSEAVALGEALEALERPKAKERQATAGPAEGRGKKTASSKLDEPVNCATGGGKLPPPVANGAARSAKGKTRDKVAPAVGMSPRTYEKAKAVIKAAEEDPEKFGPVKEQMDRTGKVDGAFQKVQDARKPPRRYPYSELLINWLHRITPGTNQVQVELGGIKAMLADRGKWDWKEVRNYLLPMLGDLAETIAEFKGEIQHAAEKG